jgi:hypothetical protein
MKTIEKLNKALCIDLTGLAKKVEKQQEFVEVCNQFLKTGKHYPVDFCKFLKQNGFPTEGKAICRYIMEVKPQLLS